MLRIPTARAGRMILAAAFAAALGGGCGASSTSLVNMWKDPEYTEPPMRKVLVIAMHKDQAMRRNWEDGFSEELREKGVEAVPSYRIFPGDLPDTQRVIAAVRGEGYDGVLLTRPLGTETQTRYVPGYVRTVPALGYDPWYGVYYNYYRRIYEPGYVETTEIVRYETDVLSTQGRGRLVWTGTTESVDPKSSRSVSEAIGEKIVPELVRQGVLAARG